MADLGVKKTEERVKEIRDRLEAVYREARNDLQKKAEEYAKKFAEQDKKKIEEKNSGKISEQDYKNWQSLHVFAGEKWNDRVRQMTNSLVNVERTAVQIVRDGQMDVFADNSNYMSYSIDKTTGFSANFGIYDANAVMRLVEEEPELLRRRYVDGVKCEAWNQKIISNCITQGIIQGESIDKIARRIARDTASRNEKDMISYARTAMTAAQNAGRQRAMEKSLEQGIVVMKVWIATMDDRTRDAHQNLDGQVVDVKEPFSSDLGPIMYPGDPNAADANVWNCRCTLGFEYPDNAKVQYDEEGYYEEESEEEYEAWYNGREEQTQSEIDERHGYRQLEMFDVDKGESVSIDERSIQAINSASKDVTNDIPRLDDYIRRIVFGKVDGDTPAEHITTISNGYVGVVIALREESWKDYDAIKAFVKGLKENRENIQSEDPRSIIAHEYGHAALSAYSFRLAGYDGYGKITNSQQEAYIQASMLIMGQVDDIIKANGSPYLSVRAAEDTSEYIAEAFGDFYYGERNKVSEEIVELFRKGLE